MGVVKAVARGGAQQQCLQGCKACRQWQRTREAGHQALLRRSGGVEAAAPSDNDAASGLLAFAVLLAIDLSIDQGVEG